jgi:ATP-dependent DNA helicase RecG
MNFEQLHQLARQGESQCLEFKKSTAQIKPAFETLCAFLNTKGGTVLLGVKNSGELIGQSITDYTKQELANEIKKIEPNAQIEIHYVPLENNNQVIVLEVPPGKHTPYAYDGRPFERNQSTTERMTQHRYEQLIVDRGQLNHSWEDQPANEYGIDDLDYEEIKAAIKEGVNQNRIAVEVLNYDIERILSKFELIKDGQLTNAAVVLFAKEITSKYSQCTIKLARFRGCDKLGDFIDNQRVSGSAFEIVRAAHAFAARHLPIASTFEAGKLARIDQPAVPALALREALINSICHRDYTVRSSTISLAIYDDRLELWNVGKLSPHLRLEDLKTSHDSFPRNENIAMVFYKRGWIESWGTGTTRMIGYCKNNGTPEPEFTESSGGLSIIFPFKEPMNTGVQIQHPTHHELTLRQQEIISILDTNGELPLKEIVRLLADPPSERTVREDVTILRKIGVIDSHGKARTTTWFLVKK